MEEKHSIYDKLSDEADKIRKWKVETEFDQKIKDREIRSLKQSIENYKKNLREINEEKKILKIQLQNEKGKSDDYAEKHKINRSLLKEINSWYEQVENKFKKVAEEKQVLVECVEHQKKEVFDFAEKFEKMCILQEKSSSSFDCKVMEARKENDELKVEIQKINDDRRRQEQESLTQRNILENELKKLENVASENEGLKEKLCENEKMLMMARKELERLGGVMRGVCEEGERGVEREAVLREEVHRLEDQVVKECERRCEVERVMGQDMRRMEAGMEAMLQEESRLKECLSAQKQHNDDLGKLNTELSAQLREKVAEVAKVEEEWQCRWSTLSEENEAVRKELGEVEKGKRGVVEEVKVLEAEVERLQALVGEQEEQHGTSLRQLQLQLDDTSKDFNTFAAEMTSKHEIEMLEQKKLVEELKEVVQDHQNNKKEMANFITSLKEKIREMEKERCGLDEDNKCLVVKVKEKEMEICRYKEEEVFKMKEIDKEVQKLMFNNNKNLSELSRKQHEVQELKRQLQEASLQGTRLKETPKLQCKNPNVPKSLDSSLSQKKQTSRKTEKTRIQKENKSKKEDIDWLLM